MLLAPFKVEIYVISPFVVVFFFFHKKLEEI